MNNEKKIEVIRRKTRQRLLFAAITLVLYFSYIFNYTTGGAFLGEMLGDSHVSGSLVMFACLIVCFIGLEILFLVLNPKHEEE